MSSDPIKPRTFRGLISMAMLVLSCLSHADGARSPSPMSPRQDQFIPLRFHKMHANGDDFVVVDSPFRALTKAGVSVSVIRLGA